MYLLGFSIYQIWLFCLFDFLYDGFIGTCADLDCWLSLNLQYMYVWFQHVKHQ